MLGIIGIVYSEKLFMGWSTFFKDIGVGVTAASTHFEKSVRDFFADKSAALSGSGILLRVFIFCEFAKTIGVVPFAMKLLLWHCQKV